MDASEDVEASCPETTDTLFVPVSAQEVLGVDALGCGGDDKCDIADRFSNFCPCVHGTCD